MSPLRSPETDPPRPTLRQRGAELKAGLARVLRCREAPAAVTAETVAAPPFDLAAACDAAVARLTWVNTNDEPVEAWPDERTDAENAAFDAVLLRSIEEPARDLATLTAKARLLRCEWQQNVGAEGGENIGERALDAFLREVAAFGGSDLRSARATDRLVADIIAGWAGYAAAEGGDDERAFDRVYARRSALLDAAEALPATRDSLTAKALALAWISYVHLWERGRDRADYATDGRLALDINAIIRAAPDASVAITGPDPFLAAVAVARAADSAVAAFSAQVADRKPAGWIEQESALTAEQRRTRDAALATIPTTRAGQIALLDYLAELVGQLGYANGDPPDDESEVWRLGYRATAAALRAPIALDIEAEAEAPVTAEHAATLDFDAYDFEAPLLSPKGWAERFAGQGVGMHIADKTLRMTKAEMVAFIDGAMSEPEDGGKTSAELMLDVIEGTRNTFDGYAQLLATARARYFVAFSTAFLTATGEG